jgi:hypothetical protein
VDLWGSVGRVPAALSMLAPPRQLSFDEVSADAECDLLVSEVQTWPVREVTLSALLTGALCLSDVAATAESAALSAAAAADPGAAPPNTECPLKS